MPDPGSSGPIGAARSGTSRARCAARPVTRIADPSGRQAGGACASNRTRVTAVGRRAPRCRRSRPGPRRPAPRRPAHSAVPAASSERQWLRRSRTGSRSRPRPAGSSMGWPHLRRAAAPRCRGRVRWSGVGPSEGDAAGRSGHRWRRTPGSRPRSASDGSSHRRPPEDQATTVADHEASCRRAIRRSRGPGSARSRADVPQCHPRSSPTGWGCRRDR